MFAIQVYTVLAMTCFFRIYKFPQEQRNSMTQYLQLNKKYQECQKLMKEMLEEKRQVESKTSRSLRRGIHNCFLYSLPQTALVA